jgi:hypothetical protein
MTRRPLRLLAAAGAALALAACDTGPAETEVEPPTEQAAVEEVRAQADQVCRGTRGELQLVRTELYDRDAEIAVAADEAQQPFDRAAALLQTELAQLRELEAPEDLAADVASWLDEVERAAAAYEEAAAAEEAAAEALERTDPLLAAEEQADDLGMGLCGSERLPDDEIGDPRSVPTEDETTAPAADDEQDG